MMRSQIAFATRNREEYLGNRKGVDRNWSILIHHFLNCIFEFDFVEESFQESSRKASMRLLEFV